MYIYRLVLTIFLLTLPVAASALTDQEMNDPKAVHGYLKRIPAYYPQLRAFLKARAEEHKAQKVAERQQLSNHWLANTLL